MRTIRFTYSFFILAGAFLLAACEENETDSTAPTIHIESPADHDAFTPGETLTFAAVFSDNVELRSYKIDVHHNSDGHSHGRLAHEDGHPWDFTQTGSFEPGTKETQVTHAIAIPAIIDGEEVASGEYHLAVFCTDAAGNENQAFVEIELAHDHDEE